MKIGHLDIPEHAVHHGTGLASWQNKHNGFQILTTHYSADPEKRSAGWRKMASTGYTLAAWDQEYEMSFKTWAGRACYPGFSDLLHVFKKDPQMGEGLSWNRQRHMCRGWDIGVHACIWAQRMNGRLSVYTARIVSGAFGQDENPVRYKKWEVPVSGLRVFIEHCVELSNEWFPGAQWRDFVDPAAWHDTVKKQGDKPVLEFEKAGLTPEPGVTQDIALRISSVENWLARMTNKRPSFQVDEGELLVIDGLSGGYQYGKEGTDKKPEKNGHCVDDQTEMLTKQGWKRWHELTPGETVYAYDLEQNRLVDSTLEAVNTFKDAEYRASHYQNMNLDMVVTPEHRCVVRHRGRGLEIIKAADLNTAFSIVNCGSYTNRGRPPALLSDNIVRLCAWVMTEGYYRNDGGIAIYQSRKHNPQYCDELDELLNRFPCNSRFVRKNGQIEYIVRKDIAYLIRSLMPEKYPTAQMIQSMSLPQMRLFLYEAIRGDGTWGRGEYGPLPPPPRMARARDFFSKARPMTPRFYQQPSRKPLIDALQWMATLAGIPTHIKFHDGKSPRWALSFLRPSKGAGIDLVDKAEKTLPFVWCPTTSIGTWVARRNGIVFFTGNSHVADALQYLCGHMTAPEPGVAYSDPEEQRLTGHIDAARHDVGVRTFQGQGGALAHQVESQAWDDY